MNNSQFLMNLKDSILRNQKNCNIDQLKALTKLYVYDTTSYSKINKQLNTCNTLEVLLQIINTAIMTSIDEECAEYGGLVNNTSSVTNQLMHLKPLFIDFYYTYDEKDLPILLSSFICSTLEQYVGKGISKEYFTNLKNKLYTFNTYDEITEYIDTIIESGKKYAKEHKI